MAEQLEWSLAEVPTLRAPVLLTAFAGWGDGAGAGTRAIQYLLGKYEAPRVAAFDSDAIYDYTVTRPLTLRRDDGERELTWPTLELYACPLPEAERDVLLLLGPEPNLRWRACAEAIVAAAQRCRASGVVVLGSYWDRVTHLGHPLLTARSGDAALQERLAALSVPESSYQGPTGFASALLDACARHALPAAGLSGRAPYYAQGIAHPKLAWVLLETARRLYGPRFELADLVAAGREQERLLTEHAQQDPRLWAAIQQLAAEQGTLGESEAFAAGPWQTLAAGPEPDLAPTPPISGEPLPSGKTMVDAVEAFLRGTRREP